MQSRSAAPHAPVVSLQEQRGREVREGRGSATAAVGCVAQGQACRITNPVPTSALRPWGSLCPPPPPRLF